MSAYTLGHLIYFFEIAVGLSGYLNGVNPFDQPGSRSIQEKHVCFTWKTGFEDLAKELNDVYNRHAAFSIRGCGIFV